MSAVKNNLLTKLKSPESMAINNSNSADYIGAGLAFPISTNAQGSFQLSNGTTNLEESIRIILGTKLGERVHLYPGASNHIRSAPSARMGRNILTHRPH